MLSTIADHVEALLHAVSIAGLTRIADVGRRTLPSVALLTRHDDECSDSVLLGGVQILVPVAQTLSVEREVEATLVAHAGLVHLSVLVEESGVQGQRQEGRGIRRVKDDASEFKLGFLNRCTLLHSTERQLVTTLQTQCVDDVCVSAGQRGVQLRLKSSDLISFTNAVVGDFAMRS